MENCEDTQKEPILLALREVKHRELHLIYRLECNRGFWLSVALGDERADTFVGSDLERAWELFGAVSAGRVTPCTLEEVCADFFAFVK